MKNPENTTGILPAGIFLWFDLDDTLWDMTGNSNIVLRQIFHSDPDVRRAYGNAGADAWMDTYHSVNSRLWELYADGDIDRATLRTERFAEPLRMAGLSRAEAADAAARLDRDYLWQLGGCTGLVPGALAALRHISAAGIPMGIVSNGFREVQYRKLASGGIDGFFRHIVLSDDTGVNKPDSRFFDCACRSAGVEARQCVIVGDNPRTDIAGALDAGWAAAIWLVSPHCPAGSDIAARLASDPRCMATGSMDDVPKLLGL